MVNIVPGGLPMNGENDLDSGNDVLTNETLEC